MSHTTTIKAVAIRDPRAILSAVEELQKAGINIELRQNQKPRMYYQGQGDVCDYVLHLKDTKYDVGLKLNAEGVYEAQLDTFMDYVESQLGAKACPMPGTPEGRAQHAIGRFLQTYGKHAAINEAVNAGYFVESAEYDEQGSLQLVIGGIV